MVWGKAVRIAAFAAMVLGSMTGAAAALDLTNVAFAQTLSEAASIPVGHAEFCQKRPAECGPHTEVVSAVHLSDTRWADLMRVNAHVNQTVVPVTDMDLYAVEEFWTYPNGYGDCEDFVLAKRQALIEAGWPASVLLMAVVRETNGNGHAVLIVRTDRGDLVLDNQDGYIRLWSDTPYQFVKRQDQANAGRWVDMIDDRLATVTATATAGQ